MTPDPDRRSGSHTGDEAALLRTVGARIRTLRARRGMTRRALSVFSGVSERYIAQFEAGEGNASLLVLRRIGAALGVPIAELVTDASPPAEPSASEPPASELLADLWRKLSGLGAPRLLAFRRKLDEWLDRAPDPGRAGRIALIGLRGAGKSSLGRGLATLRRVPFVELDREVERRSSMDLRDIFEMHGQDVFRRLEREALEEQLATRPAMVLAAGGGIVAEAATFGLLLEGCFTVWIRAAPEDHMQRVLRQGDHRPMRDNADAMDDLRTILASREELYARADMVFDNRDRTLDESLAELSRQLDARTRKLSPALTEAQLLGRVMLS